MKLPHLYTLALVVGLGACHDSSPAEARASVTPPVTSRAKASPIARPSARPVVIASTNDAEPEPEQSSALDPESVLSDEERQLLEADDSTLTREDRVARAEAQRKLVMANPDHPLYATLHHLDEQVQSGEYADLARDMYSGRTAFPDQDQP